jgi:pyridoxine kinase
VINSVHFSNHTGYEHNFRGDVLKGEQLQAVLLGLEKNKLLDQVGHVLTGYIGSESFLEAVIDVLVRLRQKCSGNGGITSRVRFVCDPVLGDNGKFYVPPALVQVYKTKVIPLADVLTPNQFEVEQLTGIKIMNLADAQHACAALHNMGPSLIFITSLVLQCDNGNQQPGIMSILASQRIQRDNDETTKSNTLIAENEESIWKIDCPILPGVFTGTGDLCAALLLAHTAMLPNNLPMAMERVCHTMYAILERTHQASGASVQSRELRLIQSRHDIENPPRQRFKAVRIFDNNM